MICDSWGVILWADLGGVLRYGVDADWYDSGDVDLKLHDVA